MSEREDKGGVTITVSTFYITVINSDSLAICSCCSGGQSASSAAERSTAVKWSLARHQTKKTLSESSLGC